jgi:hypothetical protein
LLALALTGCGTVVDNGVVIHTADQGLALFIPFQVEVVPSEEVGEAEPNPEPEPPCDWIKGNISKSGEKIYHVPGGANYNQVKIDVAAGEQFFCNVEEAEAAGFRAAYR